MAAPYSPGSSAVWLESTPHGLSVHQAVVLRVQPEGENWRVEITHGSEIVGEDGSGARLLPMDPELAEEFARLGDGYAVLATMPEREREPEREVDGHNRERGLEPGLAPAFALGGGVYRSVSLGSENGGR
jgi:hypothetical protein